MASHISSEKLEIRGVNATNNGIALAGNFENIRINVAREQNWRERLRQVIDQAYLTDPFLDRQSLISTKGDRTEGTCEWILEHEAYKSWLNGGEPILWIYGGPGKGKTMLSIFLSQELEHHCKQKKQHGIYYFCTYQHEKRNTDIAVLRGLIYQLLNFFELEGTADKVLQAIGEGERAKSSFQDREALWNVFELLLQISDDLQGIFCVLDGLDECHEESQEFLIKKFRTLFRRRHDISPDAAVGTSFKLIIVSRDIIGLHNFNRVKLDPDNDSYIRSDIDRFISASTEELIHIDGFTGKLRSSVEKTLRDRAEGTFLWVSFVVQELSRKKTWTQIQAALKSIPKGLDKIFERILCQIDEEHREMSASILRWVSLAFTPLSPMELAVALNIQDGGIGIERAILDAILICGPFLKVYDGKVSLVHQSAREYLCRARPDDNTVLEGFRINPEHGHLGIVEVCLQVFLKGHILGVFKKCVDLDIDLADHFEVAAMVDKKPLLRYAIQRWPDHARCASELAKNLLQSCPLFFNKWMDAEMAEVWLTAYYALRRRPLEDKILSFPEATSYFGIIPFIEISIRNQNHKQGQNWWRGISTLLFGPSSTDQETPASLLAVLLRAAILGGQDAAVQYLIEQDADVNAMIDSANFGWKTEPLVQAIESRESEIVRILLKAGSHINRGHEIPPAIRRGDDMLTRRLIEIGVYVSLGSTLKTAAWFDDIKWVRLLIGLGARVEHSEALTQAAQNGDLKTIDALLAHIDEIGGPLALQLAMNAAVQAADREIVERLLCRGIQIDSLDPSGITSLTYASWEEDSAAMRLLLDLGADVNARSWSGSTTLMDVVSRPHGGFCTGFCTGFRCGDGQRSCPCSWRVADKVRLLLQNGAEVDAVDSYGRTALYFACHRRSVNVLAVSTLLQYGADYQQIEIVGGTKTLETLAQFGEAWAICSWVQQGQIIADLGPQPLLCASWRGDAETVLLLVKNGADVNLQFKGLTPLMTACSSPSFDPRIAQFLLDHGADIDANCGSALVQAVTCENEAATLFLLERGANVNILPSSSKPLTIASRQGNIAVMQLLLEHGVEVDAQVDCETALMAAAGAAKIEAMQLLLAYGADVNFRSRNGMTALWRAIVRPNVNAVQLLLDKGADFELNSADDETPVLYAQRIRIPDIRGHLLGILRRQRHIVRAVIY